MNETWESWVRLLDYLRHAPNETERAAMADDVERITAALADQVMRARGRESE